MELNQLTDEVVLKAYEAIQMKPGEFLCSTSCCPLEAVGRVTDCEWTKVLDDPQLTHSFSYMWDSLASGLRHMVNRVPYHGEVPVRISDEGAQRAVDIWNYLTDQGLITGK